MFGVGAGVVTDIAASTVSPVGAVAVTASRRVLCLLRPSGARSNRNVKARPTTMVASVSDDVINQRGGERRQAGKVHQPAP